MRSGCSARRPRRPRRRQWPDAGAGDAPGASVKRIYSASDLVDARLLADSLADARIRTHLFNANAIGAMGDLPFGETWPEVWVADDRDLDRAETIVAAHASRPAARGSVRCAGCGEDNPSNFDCCWSCGADVRVGGDGCPAVAAGGQP